DRRRRVRAHVREDDAAALETRIRGGAHLRREVRLGGLARHLDALTVQAELPSVVRTAHAALLVPSEVERSAPVRTELGDESRPPVGRAVRDHALAENLHALDAA